MIEKFYLELHLQQDFIKKHYCLINHIDIKKIFIINNKIIFLDNENIIKQKENNANNGIIEMFILNLINGEEQKIKNTYVYYKCTNILV
jgi:translation initiation factor 2 gamma subunit (eIF-2gamma)